MTQLGRGVRFSLPISFGSAPYNEDGFRGRVNRWGNSNAISDH
jgi:hypothetical protein